MDLIELFAFWLKIIDMTLMNSFMVLYTMPFPLEYYIIICQFLFFLQQQPHRNRKCLALSHCFLVFDKILNISYFISNFISLLFRVVYKLLASKSESIRVQALKVLAYFLKHLGHKWVHPFFSFPETYLQRSLPRVIIFFSSVSDKVKFMIA